MITVHKLNKEEIVINADLIETLEASPDTVVTLTTGRKFMVRDKLDDVVAAIVKYKRECHESIRVIAEPALKETPTPEFKGETPARTGSRKA